MKEDYSDLEVSKDLLDQEQERQAAYESMTRSIYHEAH